MKQSRHVITAFLILLNFSFATNVSAAPAKLIYDSDFILQQVLISKKIEFRADLAMPKIFYASSTKLQQFQDAIEPQWGFRPDVFTNAYIVKKNEIYILDDEAYYEKTKRCMDDSLAHELTHYVQVQYQKFDLDDESLEWNAIDVQTWFREKYCAEQFAQGLPTR